MKNIITLLLFIPFICMGQQSKRVGINTPKPLQTLDISKNEKEIQKIPNNSSVPNKFLGTLGISDTSVPLVPSEANNPNSTKVPASTTSLGWIPVGDGTAPNNGLIVQYNAKDTETLPKGLNSLTLSTEPGYTTEEFKATHYKFATSGGYKETGVNKYIGNGDFIASNGFLRGGSTRPYMSVLAVDKLGKPYLVYYESALTYAQELNYIDLKKIPKKADGSYDIREADKRNVTTESLTGRLAFSYPICISYKHNGQWNLYADLPHTIPIEYRYKNPDTGSLTASSENSQNDTEAQNFLIKFKWNFNGLFINQDHFGSNGKAGFKEIDIDLSNANYYNSIDGDFKQ